MEACLLLQHLNSAHVIKMYGTAKYSASQHSLGYVDETVLILRFHTAGLSLPFT